MTLGTFISDLREEMELLFSEWRFKNENGEPVHFSVFEQGLPVPTGENEPEPFPYLVIRAEDGGTTRPNVPETVRVRIIAGLYDDDPRNRGHIDLFNVIDRIRQRFERNQLLKKRYLRLQSDQYPIHWAVPDDDSFPYYFGAVELFFAIPKLETEDNYS